ncbi:hypothetical protein B0T25DRAFT_442771 [Lasiosphaeria hispida]|uniref:Uncharacterized protein n=1 Tax=Lasiosphaeria hispida TaxID=260671 RepID=A0AAJ0HWG1_9PEZI|nr:hypothetical protein B0T25DRAFT_442771 [Lasiosphaeria hispida]
MDCAEGEIQAAIALDTQYPKATWAKVALRVVDGATTTGTWVQDFETLYDDKLVEQSDGQLGLYISEFLGPAGLMPAFCRPSTSEVAAGVSRDPQIILTYDRLRSIFLKARSIHQGTYHEGDYDEVETMFTIIEEAELERQHADSERQRAESERQRANEVIAVLEEQLRLVQKRV